MDKLSEYQGITGKFHAVRDEVKEKAKNWKDGLSSVNIKSVISQHKPPERQGENDLEKYAPIFRRKTIWELIRISAAVMGIEFSYAAETAFVSPTLLEIGVDHSKMTMVWALSPLIGFFLLPVLGSLSDKCNWKYGRRRPFILLLSVGIVLGLILIPNGEAIGKLLGDTYRKSSFLNNTSDNEIVIDSASNHPWGVFFVILGTVLLDFSADACQSPSRAYLLDVTVQEDHAKGLSTYTIMAGIGGFFGYSMSGFNWDVTFLGNWLGGHVKAAFTLVTFLFIICVTSTMTSFAEIPLDMINEKHKLRIPSTEYHEETPIPKDKDKDYGAVNDGRLSIEQDTTFGIDVKTENIASGTNAVGSPDEVEITEPPTLKEYLLSLVYMPYSLKILCLTNLFCWMGHVCYSLNFTDFVGEAVFGGNPNAPEDSPDYKAYEEGIRFGCWGMSMYSLSCSAYSLIIEKLIKRFKGMAVYVGGTATFGFGMLLMAILRNRVAVIIFSCAAGVMYSTLFTMPFLLLARYHFTNKFDANDEVTIHRRGLGTDIAFVGSMVFLAQFALSMVIGTLVSLAGTTTVYVLTASLLGFCASICATQVLYSDL